MHPRVSASSSLKRSRTNSSSNTLSSLSPSPSPEPTPKAARTALPSLSSNTSRELFCTLPPTCHPPNNRPTYLADSRELEAHYGKYHAHVCEANNCGAVFPDARLFELHQNECHDPLVALRRERGEKIFACHVATCARCFLTPKARRLHMIQVHEYPKEYFFAVTNKGIGGLLRKWGEGASMLRGTWKARSPDAIEVDEEHGDGDDDEEDDGEEDIAASDVHTEDTSASEVDVHGEVDGSSQSTVAPRPDRRHTPRRHSKDANADTNADGREDPHARPLHPKPQRHTRSKGSAASASDSIDALTTSLNSLSLLPSSVRFGRGTAHGGFMLAQRGRGYGRGGPRGGRRGMHHGGIGSLHDSQAAGGERSTEAAESGARARAGDDGNDSRVMIPRVLTGKREKGKSGDAAGASRGRGRGGKNA